MPLLRQWQLRAAYVLGGKSCHSLPCLEALYRQHLDEHYSELAHHYSHSGNTPKAVDYLQRAGH